MLQDRLSTGIPGLEEVLYTGFISRRAYLVRGGPGTGKTTLGLHFLATGAANGEQVLYITLGESAEQIRMNAEILGFESNVVKYSHEGSTVDLKLIYQNGEVIFQIQDQGIGIPPEDIARLFESFHRASNVKDISGTGLGLAIVKKCVDLQGGKITVISEVGSTTFTVSLPLQTQISIDSSVIKQI